MTEYDRPYLVGETIKVGDGSVWTVDEDFPAFQEPNAYWFRVKKTKSAPDPFVPGYYRRNRDGVVFHYNVYPGWISTNTLSEFYTRVNVTDADE